MFSEEKFAGIIIPSTLVLIGSILTRGSEKLPTKTLKQTLQYTSIAMFVIGWLLLIRYTGKYSRFSQIASILILLSSLILYNVKQDKKSISILGKVLFAVGWILLGFFVSAERDPTSLAFGLVSAIVMIITTLLVLPFQRQLKMVDGPGIMMQTLAWVLLAMSHSYIYMSPKFSQLETEI